MSSKNHPSALTPVYVPEELHKPFCLYRGRLEVVSGGNTAAGKGDVCFDWLPSPRIRFSIRVETVSGGLTSSDALLKLVDAQVTAEVLISRIIRSNDMLLTLEGVLQKPTILCSAKQLSYVVFHLTNFRRYAGYPIFLESDKGRKNWAGRIELQHDQWRIILDCVHNLHEIERALTARSGFAFCHTGCLKRVGNEIFTTKEAEALIETLHYFFSFARGLWSAPMLPVGFDENGNQVWHIWASANAHPWMSVWSWFDGKQPQALSTAFPGFVRRWDDEAWGEIIRNAIHWYLEANQQYHGIEGGILLCQAALELLSWVYFVEHKRNVSSGGFDRLPAADKLRLLISAMDIPSEIPSVLHELTSEAKRAEHQWSDGPQAFTEVRNAIVHPKVRERIRAMSSPARYEAWNLGQWYLELILLRLFGYDGAYANRLAHGRRSPVPWAES